MARENVRQGLGGGGQSGWGMGASNSVNNKSKEEKVNLKNRKLCAFSYVDRYK